LIVERPARITGIMARHGRRIERQPADDARASRWRHPLAKKASMIGVLEPTYGRHDHASNNAALIQGVALAFPDEDILFASSAEHRGHVEEFRPLSPRMQLVDISARRTARRQIRQARGNNAWPAAWSRVFRFLIG
jgi:hypothetical protein